MEIVWSFVILIFECFSSCIRYRCFFLKPHPPLTRSPFSEHGEGFYSARSPDGDATGIPRLRAPEHGEGFIDSRPRTPRAFPRGEGGSRRLTDEVPPGEKPCVRMPPLRHLLLTKALFIHAPTATMTPSRRFAKSCRSKPPAFPAAAHAASAPATTKKRQGETIAFPCRARWLGHFVHLIYFDDFSVPSAFE
jgi:hypothetical protein